jgi:hypothetical protein
MSSLIDVVVKTPALVISLVQIHDEARDIKGQLPSASVRDKLDKQMLWYFIVSFKANHDTYDHRLEKIGHPVRSAVLKLQIGRLVVGWVTTSEYLLLYVFTFCFLV